MNALESTSTADLIKELENRARLHSPAGHETHLVRAVQRLRATLLCSGFQIFAAPLKICQERNTDSLNPD